MSTNSAPVMISIVGSSGTGKTTILEKLIPEIKNRGLKVGTVKHHVHGDFDMDKPGKDSWRHKNAGAATSIISSPSKVGIVLDVDHDNDPEELLPFFNSVDVILTEGYKKGSKPKIEVFREEINPTPICIGDKNLIAMVSDSVIDMGVPRFSTDDMKGLAEFIINCFSLSTI